MEEVYEQYFVFFTSHPEGFIQGKGMEIYPGIGC